MRRCVFCCANICPSFCLPRQSNNKQHVNDLLATGAKSCNLKIFTDKKGGGAIVRGLKEEIVVTEDQVFSLISVGESIRHTGMTAANDKSSRSHTIFRLIVESQSRRSGDDSGAHTEIRTSTLFLTDLAGSESLKLTKATGGRRVEGGSSLPYQLSISTISLHPLFRTALLSPMPSPYCVHLLFISPQCLRLGAHINKSLLTLGKIVTLLSEKKGKPVAHLPYVTFVYLFQLFLLPSSVIL